MTNRADCVALDATDPLASARGLFDLPDGIVYLDGNSLGPLPRSVPARLARTLHEEWGDGLVRSWNRADWVRLPVRVGEKIGRLIGARPGEVVVADSTSVNLYKVLSAALALRPQRRLILSERGNFPTDLYIAQGLSHQLDRGHRLHLVERDDLPAALGHDVAVAMLSQVDYRTGSRCDLAEMTAAIHQAGALALWDLSHSAGAFPVDLESAGADFAVGCGYKYLNGGPGAPAYVYVARRHQEQVAQPLSGWFGHADPFRFDPGYLPSPGIKRYLCGTPPILSLAALEEAIDAMLSVETLGGLAAIRRKSLALSDLFIELTREFGDAHGLELMTPLDPAWRGSQVSFRLADGDQAYAVIQALIARGVIGDFRAPDVLRFGLTPLYLRFVDIFDAVSHLREVLEGGEWTHSQFRHRQTVT